MIELDLVFVQANPELEARKYKIIKVALLYSKEMISDQ